MDQCLNPDNTLEALKELRTLTSDANGAQRVAFTPVWETARKWFADRCADLPLERTLDAAGNAWFTLKGESERALLIGGHMDSVPNGGWLDGSLNLLAGLEVVRRFAGACDGTPPVTLRLVDWADEEGARFGKSLFGSSACSGNLDMEEAARLRDSEGIALPDALARCGINFQRVKESGAELKSAAAYLELHVEQGPVLLDRNLPVGAVLGTFGVERHRIVFTGQAAHSGSTPMDRRKDAFLAAAQMSPEIYRIAARHGGVCTIGSCTTAPGIVTSVVEECAITLDQRNLDATALAGMLSDAKAASEQFAHEAGVDLRWERLWSIDPIPFDSRLIEWADQAILETCGASHRLPSGPLHDAAEVARAGIPTVMLFAQSLHGISHNKIEDTREEHILLSVEVLDRLADKAIDAISRGVI